MGLIVYVAVPEPVPDPVIVTHDASDEVVQVQFVAVVTVSVPVAPLGGMVASAGLIEKVHEGLGSVTVNDVPPMVNVAVLALVPVFDPAV